VENNMARVELLTKSQLEEYGLKALKMYWEALANKPTPNFENFVDNVFYDEVMQKNYRNEDLSSYGKLVAMYILDHPFPSWDKLRDGFKALAYKTKPGMIPTRWSLNEVVTKASSINSLNDYLKALNIGINQSSKEFKGIAIKAAGVGAILYLGYALGAVLLLMVAQRNTTKA